MKKFAAFLTLMGSALVLASCGAEGYYCHGFHGKEGDRIYFSTYVDKKQYFTDGVKVKFNYAHDQDATVADSYSIYSYNEDTGIHQLFDCDMRGDNYVVGEVTKDVYTNGAYTITTAYLTDYVTFELPSHEAVFSTNTDFYLSYFFMAPSEDTVDELTIDDIQQDYPTTCVRYSYYEKYIKLV